tara:strand:+ start:235 stop:420 length:186 start_codon:yes stop_codon:yes gene_type:complete
MIESIEVMHDGNVLIVVTDEEMAKRCLKKNPRSRVTKSSDDRYGLVYRESDINLMNAIKRA